MFVCGKYWLQNFLNSVNFSESFAKFLCKDISNYCKKYDIM